MRVIKSRRLKCVKNVASMGEIRNTKKFSWKPGKQRLLGRPRHRWEDSTKLEAYGNRVRGCRVDS
jgi:hypothetical protein